jgi:hypothetical protein
VVSEQTVDGMSNLVVVVLKDNDTGATQTFTMDAFRIAYGRIMQDYHDNKKNIREKKALKIAKDSAFFISQTEPQTIGYAKILLNFLYYNMVGSANDLVTLHTIIK